MQIPFGGFTPQIDERAFIAPNAVLIGRVLVAAQASLWFNVVARGDINSIEIGEKTNIQDGCLLHVTHQHSLSIGEGVTVGHGAILHGCVVEKFCLISMGAILLDGTHVGSGSIIAAGTVISPGKRIPPNSLVMGVPGKVIREVTEQDRQLIEKGWKGYMEYAQRYSELAINHALE
jgi:carbonic anhydrase/acetyltransferase-like protein (isoleucine patch superfamily)